MNTGPITSGGVKKSVVKHILEPNKEEWSKKAKTISLFKP
jgi:hypothetical protein